MEPEEWLLDGTVFRCAKCLTSLIYLGSESVSLSSEAELEKYDEIQPEDNAGLTGKSTRYTTAKVDIDILANESVLREHPDDVDALFNLADYYFKTGELKKSRKFYERLVKVDPKHFEGLKRMADFYHQEGDRVRLMETLQMMAKAQPTNGEVYRNIGVLYLESHQTRLAIKFLTLAYQHLPPCEEKERIKLLIEKITYG